MRFRRSFTAWFATFAMALLLIVFLTRSHKPVRMIAAGAPASVAGLAGPASEETLFPQKSELPRYELKIAPSDVSKLEHSAYSNQTVPGTFIANGREYKNVKVRYRGAWARGWPKKPLKIFFEKDNPFEGQHCINLNSGWRDPAFVREPLAYYIYAACGAPASRSKVVRLDLNGAFRGVYLEVEQPDKPLLKRYGLKGASIYKASSQSNTADERDLGPERAFAAHYEKQTQKSENSNDLQQFCHGLATTRDVAGFFKHNVDIEKYVNYLAATVLVQNWDGFNKNHYIVYDGANSKKWIAVPWDLDRTLGDHWRWSFDETRLPILLGTRESPGVTGWNRMQDRFLSQPEFRTQFLDRLEQLLQTTFTPEKLFPILDQLEAQVVVEGREDRRRWPGSPPDIRGGIKQLKRYIEDRRAFLLREIPKLR